MFADTILIVFISICTALLAEGMYMSVACQRAVGEFLGNVLSSANTAQPH